MAALSVFVFSFDTDMNVSVWDCKLKRQQRMVRDGENSGYGEETNLTDACKNGLR